MVNAPDARREEEPEAAPAGGQVTLVIFGQARAAI